MSTKIYSSSYKKLDCDVGHLDDRAIVYSDSVHEVGYFIGHVDERGLVYNHPANKVGHCVGRMENDGKIYDHPNASVGHCVGHVNENGVIYNHPVLELGYDVGCVEGPLRKKAAAAYLLLFYNNPQPYQNPEPEPERQREPEPKREPQNNYNNKQNAGYNIPHVKPSGGGSVAVFYLIIALVIFMVIALGMSIIMAYPGILFGLLGLYGFTRMKEDPESFNVSPDVREACKTDANATALLWSVFPVGFGIFSACVGGLAYGILGIIAIVAPVIIVYMAMRKNYYIKNMKKAVNGEFSVKQSSTYTPPRNNNGGNHYRGQNNNQNNYQNNYQNSYQNNYQNNSQYNNARPNNAGTAERNVIVKCRNPYCQANCSVPAGKGDIIVTCPVCGRRFNERT